MPPRFFAKHLKAYEFIREDSAGKKVLEVGSGDGYGSCYLAGSAQEVIGIDYEDNVVLKAQGKYRRQNLKFLPMSALSMQFPDRYFDIVCSFQVVEHIPEKNLHEYFSEIKRVLKPDGKFYLSTLNLEQAVKNRSNYVKNPAHCKEYTLNDLKGLLSGEFASLEIYGVTVTLKHRFFQRLKKIGLFNPLGSRDPVKKFYNAITTQDFKFTSRNLRKAMDFICVCKKST